MPSYLNIERVNAVEDATLGEGERYHALKRLAEFAGA
jgi:hypothetical protein